MMGIGMAVRPPRSRGPVLMMIDALRRIGGNLWMVDNAYTGAFVDNVGTTPVTAYADLLGLATDRLGVLGSELFTGAYTVGASVTATFAGNEATATFVGGALTSSGANWLSVTTADVPLGTFCVVEFDAQWVSGSDLQVGAGYTVGRTISAAGNGGVKRRYTATTAAGHANVKPCTFGSVTPGAVWKITVISTRVMSGNHATQSAVASKPSVQRVPKRLGPNLVSNGTFDNGTTGWGATNGGAVSVSGGELVVTNAIASSGRGYQMVPTEVNKPYLITSFARAGTASAIVGWGTLAGSSAGGSVLTASAQTLQLTFVATAASTSVTLQTNTATAGHAASFDNISVREVLEWTNVISFDGSNDFLQTGITTGNEGWVCAGVTPASVTSYRSLFHSGVLASEKGVWLLSDLGNWSFSTFNGTANQIPAQIAATTSPTVVAGGWDASSVVLEVNNQSVSAVRSGDCTGVNAMRVGVTSAGSFPFNGLVTAIIYTPVLPSAADRKIIRDGIAALQGRTL